MRSSSLPSRVKNDYWVHAVNTSPPHAWTDRSGKWLIVVPLRQLDEKWKIIARETELGRLGIAAKGATAKLNGLAKNQWVKVICVYTYDSSDQPDVMRVRNHLRTLGFIKKLPYKTDQATSEGRLEMMEMRREFHFLRMIPPALPRIFTGDENAIPSSRIARRTKLKPTQSTSALWIYGGFTG